MSNYKKQLEIYDSIVALVPELKRKGKTMPYTSANGYMFSLLNKDAELGFRLSKEDQKAFTEKYESGPFMSHGAKMKDYVIIPKSVCEDAELASKYLRMSHAYVLTLPPK